MRTLRCPRCATTVQVPEGSPPACSNCGFGTNDAAASRSGPGPGVIAVIAVVAALVVAGGVLAGLYFGTGVFDGDAELSQEEARLRAEQAPVLFGTDVSSPDGGQMRSVEATVFGDDPEVGAIDGAFLLEWGQEGVFHARVDMGGGGFSFTVETYCTSEKSLMVFGADVYEARPGDDCETLFTEQDVSVPITADDVEALEIVDVEPQADGSVHATYIDENGTAFQAVIDADGRLVSLEGEDDGLAVAITISYGARSKVTLPAATERLAADVFGMDDDYFDDNLTWIALDMEDGLVRNDFTARVMDGDTMLAEFDLAGGTQTQAGFTFAWLGDTDAAFEEGDSFSIRHATQEYGWDYDVVVWDEWAGAEAGSRPLPGPSPLLVLGVLAGLALVRRRQ